jgi:hypothetical protein
MGHDSLNQMYVVQAKCERLGYSIYCEHCDGHGEVWSCNAAKYLYDTYKDIEPPTGDGWQVWETVSEGSPISPVFATSDELVTWLIGEGYSESGARKFVETEYAPSMVMSSAGVQSGIDALGTLESQE